MPVSTDVLNDDVKGLRDDLHKVETSLTGEIHQVAIGLAELRQEVKDAIGLAKWVGTLAMGVLLTSGIGAVIWGAGLTAKVYGMEARTGEKFQEVGIRIDKLESGMNARFDKLEASIAKVLDQTKPVAK